MCIWGSNQDPMSFSINLQPISGTSPDACTGQSFAASMSRISGSLGPNTYVFTTTGPRYGATMGTCPQNIDAIGSKVRNKTGTFLCSGAAYAVQTDCPKCI